MVRKGKARETGRDHFKKTESSQGEQQEIIARKSGE